MWGKNIQVDQESVGDRKAKRSRAIVDKVKDHFHRKKSSTLRQFRFYSMNRRDGESIQAFAADLRRLSQDCELGETLSDMLRDRLVCGVTLPRIQNRLLQKNFKFDLT